MEYGIKIKMSLITIIGAVQHLFLKVPFYTRNFPKLKGEKALLKGGIAKLFTVYTVYSVHNVYTV
jgi:hypothetical protein